MEHYNDFLYHHGVKGMKWGVRKERSSSGLTKRQANKINRKQYRQAKRDAKARLMKDTEAYRNAGNQAAGKAQLKSKGIDLVADTANRAIDKRSAKTGKSYKTLSDINEGARKAGHDMNRNTFRREIREADNQYGSQHLAAQDRYYMARKKAKDTYKANKKAIASGHPDVVEKGKKKLKRK